MIMIQRPLELLGAARRLCRAVCLVAALVGVLLTGTARSQTTADPGPDADIARKLPHANPRTRAKIDALIADVFEAEDTLVIDPTRSKLFRTTRPVTRFSINNPSIVEVTQYSPTEFEVIGQTTGQTMLTLWLGEQGDPSQEVIRWVVDVKIDTEVEDRRRREYAELQRMVNEMFPDSMVQLFPVAGKLIVRGEARDAKEESQIISVLSREAGNYGTAGVGGVYGGAASFSEGTAADPFPGVDDDLPQSNVINLLHVPGVQQVMLKVRIAELSRSALRQIGIDLNVLGNNYAVSSLFGVGGNLSALLSSRDVSLFFKAFASNGNSRILAEPNLVTLSGQTASFIAGGQFAVPTTVGVSGVQAATTFFQGFGTMLLFTPTVIDKDQIRLQVAPTFSELNANNGVNGIPGLNVRSTFTTVDMREGQWLAISGLLQDEQKGSSARIPILGDIPILNILFSNRTMQRNETELVVLVSPELVHPMEPEQTPLILPGMEMTEPAGYRFFLAGMIEGDPNCQHRSTVWPVYRYELMRAKCNAKFQRSQSYYIRGPHGFSH